MKSLLLIVVMIVTSQFAQAAAAHQPNMFFYCKGTHEYEIALQVSSQRYFQGQIQGLKFQIRGFYNNYNDEIFESSQMVVKQANYRPRNPALEGLDKYVVESAEYTTLALMIPSRKVLEKQWAGISDRNKSNNFKAYAQMQYRSGDTFVSIPLDCQLNWKPGR